MQPKELKFKILVVLIFPVVQSTAPMYITSLILESHASQELRVDFPYPIFPLYITCITCRLSLFWSPMHHYYCVQISLIPESHASHVLRVDIINILKSHASRVLRVDFLYPRVPYITCITCRFPLSLSPMHHGHVLRVYFP